MKLNVTNRSNEQKREAKRLRRDGRIPAALYKRGEQSETIAVDDHEFKAHLRSIKKGHLSTSIFTLVGEDGKEKRAIVKDIQYHVTTYAILHLDFEELVEDVSVNIKVPIECTGVVDCVGIKLGGVLRTVLRHLQVRCLPKDIPSCFYIDVKELKLLEKRRLKQMTIPETVRPLMDLNEVAVVIAKR